MMASFSTLVLHQSQYSQILIIWIFLFSKLASLVPSRELKFDSISLSKIVFHYIFI